MAKCSLQLNLDDSKSTYEPGELITGTVVVKVLEQCRCELLDLRWQWRTRSFSGNPDAGPVEYLLTLNKREEWLAGQELHYPFRLVAPSSPLTYHGHLMSVDWHLRAEARVSGFLDTRPHAEVPFFLVPAETKQPAPAATGPDSWRALEMKPARGPPGCLFWLGALFQLPFLIALAAPFLEAFPPLIPIIGIGYLLLCLWIYRHAARVRAMGNLWLDSEAVAPGGTNGLRIQLRPARRVREHDLSVSLECVERETVDRGEGRNTTHERAVYTERVLTCTNRALSADELLELPVVKFSIPSDAPTSFKLRNHELRWRLRIEWKLKGRKRAFLQLVPFQVQPPPQLPRATAPRHQALQASSTLPARPAPWLQSSPPREGQRRGPRPSEDVRRQLEGRLEVLEAAHAHYTALEEALRGPKWKLHLRPRLDTLRETIRQEPALVEALERLHHRARSEGWAGTEPALVLAHEVEELRARVGAFASRHPGSPDDQETPLARRLERLEQSVTQSLPAPLARGEKLLCAGRFSPSLSLPGLLLLPGLFFIHCGTAVGTRGEGWLLDPVFWGAWLVLTALCLWSQYRRSGRFWLTENRLIWLPTRGDPLEISPRDIRLGGSGYRYPKSVKVDLADGRTLHLAFISRARLLNHQLLRQRRASRSGERQTPGP
jgi:hypothetical protein